MRSIITAAAVCLAALLCPPADAAAQCLTPSESFDDSAGYALSEAVDALEDQRTGARRRPSVLVTIAALPPVSGGGQSQADRAQLRKTVQGCLDDIGLERRVRIAAQGSVRFVAGAQFADVIEALERIEQVGLANIDPATRNVLRIRDINYLAYVKPRAVARGTGPTSVHLEVDVDVVSVETSAIHTESATLFDGESAIASFGAVRDVKGGLPPGAITLPCGCHGFVQVNATRANPQCQSGQDVAQACQLSCFAPNGAFMGQQWGAVCR